MKFGVEHVLGDSERIEYIDGETNDLTLMNAIPLVDHPNLGFSVLLNTTTIIGVWDTRHGTRVSRPLRQSRHGGIDIERARGSG